MCKCYKRSNSALHQGSGHDGGTEEEIFEWDLEEFSKESMERQPRKYTVQMTRWEPLPLLFLCVDLNQSLDLALKEPFTDFTKNNSGIIKIKELEKEYIKNHKSDIENADVYIQNLNASSNWILLMLFCILQKVVLLTFF